MLASLAYYVLHGRRSGKRIGDVSGRAQAQKRPFCLSRFRSETRRYSGLESEQQQQCRPTASLMADCKQLGTLLVEHAQTF